MTPRRDALRDDPWERIQELLPGGEGTVGVSAKNNRLFVEAVLYRYRAGIAWRELPERLGDSCKVHTRLRRWVKQRVWERVLQALAEDASAQSGGKRGDANAQAIGRSKGGLSPKLQATVDALGHPIGFPLTSGQACDRDGVDVRLADIQAQTV